MPVHLPRSRCCQLRNTEVRFQLSAQGDLEKTNKKHIINNIINNIITKSMLIHTNKTIAYEKNRKEKYEHRPIFIKKIKKRKN